MFLLADYNDVLGQRVLAQSPFGEGETFAGELVKAEAVPLPGGGLRAKFTVRVEEGDDGAGPEDKIASSVRLPETTPAL